MTLPRGAREVRPLGGGDINEAFRVRLADGREAFVKTRADAPAGEYAAEAAGLAWLAEPGALRTPRVLAVERGYLALEWVQPGRLDVAGEEQLGRGLAATHAAGAPAFGGFDDSAEGGGESGRAAGVEDAPGAAGAAEGRGGDAEGRAGDAEGRAGDAERRGGRERAGDLAVGWLGGLRVSNERADDWPTFYAERRLLPLARRAREADALSAEGAGAVERVCERIAELTGPAEPPARLHGDLWQGNVLADTRGRPWLIDPAAYGGHREVDLAMLALFGSLSESVLGSYSELTPLADGWQDRVGLYQLLPLLVHALLFGGSYSESAARMARRYAR